VSSPADVDALFRLPLPEFTAARNALAAELKGAGRAEDAARVRGLPKPPLSTWAVNQLYWRHRKPFDSLITAGQRLRTAQAAQLRGKPGELREPLEARRAALSELTKHASALLKESGHTPSPDLMRRITTTLEALATYGSHAAAPPAGRLTDDVDAPGFEALAALMPRKGARGRTRVLPFVPPRELKAAREKLDPEERKRQEQAERRARLSTATAALRDAERTLAEARRTAARAEASLKKAAARAKETKKNQDALSAQFEKASAAAEQARQEAHRIASEAEEAAQAVADAERALEEANKLYAELTS
jgi:DNA repair exonuclease SbcCD ATPase subunit